MNTDVLHTPSQSQDTILVVDDTRENLRLLVSILSEHGYQVRPATNGPRALAAAHADPPDLILLDIMMPGMDGYAVCEALKADAHTRDIPVIFISALSETFDKVQAFAVGGVDYITKPFQVEEVLVRVDSHLTMQRTQAALRESEARYRAVVEDQTELVCRLRPDTVLTFINLACCRYFGQPPEAMLGQSFLAFIPPHERDRVRTHLASFDSQTTVQSIEFCVIDQNGTTRWLQWTTRAILDARHALTEFQAVGRDITERVQAEEQVRLVNRELEHSVRELQQHARQQEILNRLSSVLQRCQTPDEAYGISLPFLRDLFADQSGALYVFGPGGSTLTRAGAWGSQADMFPSTIVRSENCPVLAGGRINLVETPDDVFECAGCIGGHATPYVCVQLVTGGEQLGMLHVQSDNPGIIGNLDHWSRLATMVADLFALALANIRLREQLREQAIRDPLTGLFNRRFLDETLLRELSQAIRYQRPLSVVLLDIDHFKRISDVHGHEAGDAVLHTLGKFLRTAIRSGDIACRFGGDEIILVLPELALADTQARAEHLAAGIRQLQFAYDDRELPTIAVSLGIANFPEHGFTAEALITAADAALYRAKATGRNRVCVAEIVLPGVPLGMRQRTR